MHASQTTSITLTAQPLPNSPTAPHTQIKQNQPNQDYSKTTLRPPQDPFKTSLRQHKQINQFQLTKQFLAKLAILANWTIPANSEN